MSEQSYCETQGNEPQKQGHGAAHGTGGKDKPPFSGSKAVLLIIIVLVVAAVLAVTGIIPRLRAAKKLQSDTTQLAAADVTVDKPQMGKPNQEVILPGNISAYTDSAIFARTSGYLQKWYFDIGAHVKEGQLLAEIASPEIDQQLSQAKADLTTAEANASIAKIQSTRYQDLLKQNAVATQDTDTFVTQQASTTSQVKSAQANVQHLEELVGFEKVYAPFSGILTARDVDTGTLIDAGASKELFHMTDQHILRVYVNVPQTYSQATVPGVTADLTFAEFPGRRFQGKIVRTSKTIDPASRTLLVEVDVDNRKGELFPGAYTEVHFKLDIAQPTLILPVSTLMFRQEGLRVATVVDNNKAKLLAITIGQDDGKTVQVTNGLQANDLVIQNPPDSLVDGQTVRIVQPQQDGQAESPQPKGQDQKGLGSK
jgi:RND family efflux transporter MFP subunit